MSLRQCFIFFLRKKFVWYYFKKSIIMKSCYIKVLNIFKNCKKWRPEPSMKIFNQSTVLLSLYRHKRYSISLYRISCPWYRRRIFTQLVSHSDINRRADMRGQTTNIYRVWTFFSLIFMNKGVVVIIVLRESCFRGKKLFLSGLVSTA